MPSTVVQIRSVPRELHRRLKARAAMSSEPLFMINALNMPGEACWMTTSTASGLP